jgi:hypothetical protein
MAALLVASGCRFLVETGDLQSGTAGDSGVTPIPTSTVTSSPDTGSPPPVDSGPAETGPVETGPPPFCRAQGTIHFCADFDVAGANIGTAALTGGGLFAIEANNPVSAPNAALMTAVASATGVYSQSRYFAPLPVKALKSVTLEFAMRPEAAQLDKAATEFAEVSFANGNNEAGFIWKYNPGATGIEILGYSNVNGAGRQYAGPSFGAPTLNTWHTFKVVFELGNPANGGAGAKITATYDGKTEVLNVISPSNMGREFYYGPGQYATVTPAVATGKVPMRFDNIAVRVTE